jgi:perosamine synthetase
VVLADVDPRTWTLDPADVEARISARTRAIVAVHLYGRSADLDRLRAIARKRSLRLIEDVAQALGARWRGRPLGSIGEVGCFSFYGNKVITTGEGGMVTTRSRAIADRLRALRNHCTSASRRYFHRELGFNYRMTALQAAVGLAQLEQLESFLAKRTQIAAWYRACLRDLAGWTEPAAAPASAPVNWLFTLKLRELSRVRRDALLERLRNDGVDARPVFVPMSQLPAHRTRKRGHAAAISGSGLSLPTYVSMQKSDVRTIADLLRHALLATKQA